MMEKRRKIGIMGGTFNPIHYGHLMIAENAAEQYGLDLVLFMPNGTPPHKPDKKIVAASHRIEMIRLAIQDNPSFQLSLDEVNSGETSYTYRTLERLKEKEPEDDFYFIMGGDSLKYFDTWRYPERILRTAYVLAAIRDNVEGAEFQEYIDHLNHDYEAMGVFPLNTPNFSVSSSKIRDLIQNQKTVRYMLPENVREYIMEHLLYRSNSSAISRITCESCSPVT